PDNLKEFILYVKANAEKVNVAHAGVGSITHSTCLLLNSLLGVRPTFVPFTGAAPAMNPLLGGQVDYMCNAIPDAVQQVQSGAVKGYAISTAQRSPALPNVPTARKPVCPSSRHRLGTPCLRPRGRRSQPSTSSSMGSTERLTTKVCASACSNSAAIFRIEQSAARNRLLPWSRAKSRVGRRFSRQQASEPN